MHRVRSTLSGVQLPDRSLGSCLLGHALASVSSSVDNHKVCMLNDLCM